MKIIITIINGLSTLPILFFPVAFISSFMLIAVPSAGKSFISWVIFILTIVYPAIIIYLIVLSRKQWSLAIALIGLIPLLIFLFLFFSDSIKGNKKIAKSEKEFICDNGEFLIALNPTSSFKDYYIIKKKLLIFYKKSHKISSVYNDKYIIFSGNISDENKEKLKSCKNNKGESFLNLYREVRDIDEVLSLEESN